MWSHISNVRFKVVAVCIYSVVGANVETCKYFVRDCGIVVALPRPPTNTESVEEAEGKLQNGVIILCGFVQANPFT